MRINLEQFTASAAQLRELLPAMLDAPDLDTLRGMEGAAASIYFGCFDDMILGDKEHFFYHGRNRRPPLDNVNALLSFVYTLLGNDCASALESVGLDAYVGFLHRDRPGRTSLAQDLLEELRPCLADRFVLTLINNRIVSFQDFQQQENGAVLLCDEARRTVLRPVAGAEKGADPAPVPEGKDSVGADSLCAGAAPGPLPAGRSGCLSAIFVEVRGAI